MKKQHYMTWDERCQLEAMFRNKIPVAEMARQLGFSRQAIYNELKLGAYDYERHGFLYRRYSADKAQQIHAYNQTAKGRPLKIGNDHAYAQFLESKIVVDRYSPAAALAAARQAGHHTTVCVGTLYSYISKRVFLRLTNKDLWIKGKPKKKKKKKVQRIAHPQFPSILNRPDYINDRSALGHWEMDLIVGKSGSRSVLLTLLERVSREVMIFKLPNKQAVTVRGVFDRLEQQLPDFRQRFQSITTDNGSEFLQYEDLRRSIYGGTRFDVYYCHSYAAWEKGANECHNRMIRRWFPKGTNFTKVPASEIRRVQDWLNSYPRRCLGWQAPQDFAC